jgi:hypothetical protein
MRTLQAIGLALFGLVLATRQDGRAARVAAMNQLLGQPQRTPQKRLADQAALSTLTT